MVWGGRREAGSGWGTHVYLWRIHFNKKKGGGRNLKKKNYTKKKKNNANLKLYDRKPGSLVQ